MFIKIYLSVLVVLLTSGFVCRAQNSQYVIVIHGGAGNISSETLSDFDQVAYYDALNKAVSSGAEMLDNGAAAIDVVTDVVCMLEDNPLFNAGKGAAFTREGANELEAAVMDGKTLNAGAVACIKTIKNPVAAALKVMKNSSCVFMVGPGADAFAKMQGLKTVDNSYFFTFDRWNEFRNSKQREMETERALMNLKGTVGCVCLDKYGNVASATSTGGTSGKRPGRVGDTPIIGAGTYADNSTCAVSCAGFGEAILVNGLAREVSLLMKYKGYSLDKASSEAIQILNKPKRDAALIAVDAKGNFSIKFNTPGMFRAYKTSSGLFKVQLFEN